MAGTSPIARNVLPKIVLDQEVACGAAIRSVLPDEEDAAARMLDDVVREFDVVNDSPRHAAVDGTNGKDDRVPILVRTTPVIFEGVAVDGNPLCSFQFQVVLSEYLHGNALHPAQGLVKRVVLDQDVRRNHALYGGNRSAEANVLGARFQVIVGDLIRARAVPTGDRLRVLPVAKEAGDVAIFNCRGSAIESDAALPAHQRISVNVIAIKINIVRQLAHSGFVFRASLDQILDVGSRYGVKLDANDVVVIGASINLECRTPIWRHDFRHRGKLRWSHPRSGGRQRAHV